MELKEKLKFKGKTWSHNHFSDLFLLNSDCIPNRMAPGIGSEKTTGLGTRSRGFWLQLFH